VELPKAEKGRSHSTRPVAKRPPAWCRYQPEEVEAIVVRLAKEGYPASKIGIILRDQHGVPLCKPITGKPISQIMREQGLESPVPEDLDVLLKKASRLRAHLERNNKDQHNKRALQIIEAKIRRLARYYTQKGLLPSKWKYNAKTPSL
jgi:small subunit ribosomal protein S15